MDDGMATTRAAAPDGSAAAATAAAASFDFDRALIALLPRLRLQALALAHNSADADDLVQDAVRNALGARHSFTPGTDLVAWLYRILRNRFISKHRRAREATGREADLAAAAPHAPGAQEDTLALGELRRALARLPAEQRVALVAVAVQGMRYEGLAAATGCAVGTAKSRVFRARNRLRIVLLGAEAPPRPLARVGRPSAAGVTRRPQPRAAAVFGRLRRRGVA